jgi:hypothetical protein
MPARPRVNASVPAPDEDRPRVGRLGIAVAVCFLLGLLWPLLAGLTFVQRPPGSTPAAKPEDEAPPLDVEPEPSPPRAPSAEPKDAVRAAAALKLAVTTDETVRIEGSVMGGCSDDGKAVSSCDTPNLGALIEESIEKLAHCDAAEGAAGVLSLGLRLDFDKGHVTQVKTGQSTTFSKEKADALSMCAKDHVVGTPLDGVAHKYAAYWLYYRVRFLPPGSPMDLAEAPPADVVVSASGQGTIGWKTALVRQGPSSQAKIAGRLLYGTRVNVTGRVGEWYRIEHGGSTGWVHGDAIGM